MTGPGRRTLIALAACVALLALLFYATLPFDPERYERMSVLIQTLEIENEELVRDLLLVRTGAIRHFDTLNAHEATMRETIDRINMEIQTIPVPDRDDLQDDIASVRQLVDARSVELEDFKSAIAILRNSLMYFDRLVGEEVSRSHGAGSGAALLGPLATLSAALLRSSAIPNGTQNVEPDAILKQIKSSRGNRVFKHLLEHAEIVVSYSAKVNQAVAHIVVMPVDDQILALRTNYRHAHDRRVAQAEHYRVGLSIVAMGLIGLVGVMLWRLNDATRRLSQMVDALGESESRFRQLAETIREVFWLTDAKTHKVIYASPAFEQLWGRPVQRLYDDAMEWIEGIHPEDRRRVSESFEKQALQGVWLEEYRVVQPDGTERWIRDRGFPVHDTNGSIVRIAGIAEDVTEQRAAQSELQRHRDHLEELVNERTAALQDLNRELEAFSYSVSHDLRAPLRAIDGFSQALLEDYSQQFDTTAKQYLQRVRAAAQRMGRLIDDLLQLSRVTRTEMQNVPVDMTRVVNEIVADLRAQDPARQVSVDVAAGLQAHGDAALLRIALENLLGNAWKFTARKAEAEIRVGYTFESGHPVFFVKDNGAGFDMKFADKLFGAFQRLHPSDQFEGTGIGLATVQRIIHRHGGQVWADAAPGHGATFFFRLTAASVTNQVKMN